MRNFTDNLVNGILSFFLSIVLIVALVVATLGTSFLNKDSITNKFTSVTYCQNVLNNVINKVSNLCIPSQIDIETVKSVITFDQVEIDTAMFMSRGFEDSKYTIDTLNMKTNLVNSVKNQFNKENIVITDDVSQSISLFADQVINCYVDSIDFEYIMLLIKAVNMFNNALIAVWSVIIVSICILFAMIFVFNKYIHRALRQVAISFSTASLFGLVVSLTCLISGFYRHLNIAPFYFNNAISTYISKGFVMLLVFSCALIVINIINYVIIWSVRRTTVVKK